jgi:hypothetical protein
VAAALAAGLLGVLIVAAFFLLRGPQHPALPEDALRAGSFWKGTYRFRPPQNDEGPVEVHVTRREGDCFWGTYATDGGKYEWRIEGTARGAEVRWEFTEVVREAQPQDVVGKAHVWGTYDSKVMDVVFHHEVDDSTADMQLGPVK